MSKANQKVINAVNMAIYLRRPLLVAGSPGSGKSSLAYAIAYAVARELELGQVLHWPINTRSTLQEGLYHYDAITRLQDAQINQAQEVKFSIGDYIRLRPLGTAMCSAAQPRVLLIDEIDKSDIDLPNDLLTIFEEGYFVIEELQRLKKHKDYHTVTVQTYDGGTHKVVDGRISCEQFPIVIMTSNGEREFPLAFKRRCIQLEIEEPKLKELTEIVKAHLGDNLTQEIKTQISQFVQKRGKGPLATDHTRGNLAMWKNFSNLTGNSLIKIAIIIALTMMGLTYLTTKTQGQFDLCVYKDGVSVQIRGQSPSSEQKRDGCLSGEDSNRLLDSN